MRLSEYPTSALMSELARRNREPGADPSDASVIVGDLEVDPLGCVVTWRGHAVQVTDSQCQLLYALALARWQGLHWLRTDRLAVRLYRVSDQAELSCVRQHVYYLRKRLPGLIVTRTRSSGGRFGGYGLNLEDQALAA